MRVVHEDGGGADPSVGRVATTGGGGRSGGGLAAPVRPLIAGVVRAPAAERRQGTAQPVQLVAAPAAAVEKPVKCSKEH